MRRAAFLFPAALAVPACAHAAAAPDYASVAAGRTQAILADCEGCHTAPGGKPLAGGLVLQSPFGRLAAPNITPDDGTGIGAWTKEEFRRAVKSGMAPAGRRLYPAMPYPYYARISDAEVDGLWAYLQTVAPVRHRVRANLLPFPFNIRALMAGWNALFFRPSAPAPQKGKSAAWLRGEYLVNGPGHCGACHTPKNLLGADKGTKLTGASLQGWFAPDITGDKRRGIGGWRASEVVTYLRSGHNSHAMATGPMAEVIEHSTAQMNDSDLAAIATYLKDMKGDDTAPRPLSAENTRMKAGAVLYEDNCQGCHNRGGSGQSVIFPPLAANPVVQQASAESLIRVVLAGTQAAQTARAPTAPAMPSFAWRLDDAQVADLLTYVRNSWGNAAGAVPRAAVTRSRAALQGRP
jgi:mono/diheme cytochrome c family protein